MLKSKSIKTPLLTASLLAILAGHSWAQEDPATSKIYIDPVTGEVIEYQKLLSEMTDEEKAVLTEAEYKKLKEIEAAQKAKQAERKPPG